MPLPPEPLLNLLKRPWSGTQDGKGKRKQEKGVGKPKSKGKGGSRIQTNVPAPLKGLDPNFNGEPICFDHSLKHGCQLETWETPSGPACKKGLHICVKSYGAHFASGCDK